MNQQEEDQRGHDHAAHRGGRGDERLAGRVQLAVSQFVAQLDRCDEEEDREQPILDPVPDRQVDAQQRDGEVERLDGFRGSGERAVGEDEADCGRRDEKQGGEAFGPQ